MPNNGSIGIIHNQTKDWARIDFKVIITYESDLDVVLDMIKKVIEELSKEPEWKNLILMPVVMSDVSDIGNGDVELEIQIKTRPNF